VETAGGFDRVTRKSTILRKNRSWPSARLDLQKLARRKELNLQACAKIREENER
jgi:hypothetical protein